jgi:hypothetical protein
MDICALAEGPVWKKCMLLEYVPTVVDSGKDIGVVKEKITLGQYIGHDCFETI